MLIDEIMASATNSEGMPSFQNILPALMTPKDPQTQDVGDEVRTRLKEWEDRAANAVEQWIKKRPVCSTGTT